MNITQNLRRLLLRSAAVHTNVVRTLRHSGNRHPPPPMPISAEPATALRQPHPPPPPPPSQLTDADIDWTREMRTIRAAESARSVLAPIEDEADFDVSTAAPDTRPAHNLAAYVKRSASLQQLVRLGVDLHRIEKRNGLGDFVLRLDFERDVQPRLRFLSDVGLPAEALGAFLTRNPLICKEDVDTLTTRIHYLQSKSFKPAEIARIVETNPFWLMFSTQRIDGRLGYFQKQFALTGEELRQLASRQARLITYGLEAVRKSTFVVREELGFDEEETKRLLLQAPKLWMMNNATLTERFEYVHKTMGITHERLVRQPEILYCRLHRLRERHQYLVGLGKAQYDPTRPLYVSFKQLTAGSDSEFALSVAQTTVQAFEEYLRTL